MTETEVPTKPKPKKAPQDRKPKLVAVVEADLITVVVQGFTITIDPEMFDDFELMGELHVMDSGTFQGALVAPTVLEKILGDEQYRKVMDHLRGDNGRVSLTAAGDFIRAVFTEANPNS